MKKLIIFIWMLPLFSAAQTTLSSPKAFGTIADLRGVSAADGVLAMVSGLTSRTDGSGGTYMYSASATAIDDGVNVVQPTAVTGAGRWLYMANQNTVKGNAVLSGLGLTTTYTVTHNLGFIPVQVYLQPTSADAAAALAWVDKALTTTTTFTIKYRAIPILGTSNLTYDYLIIKR